MSTVPRISTALATVLIETFFYGIYVVLFVTSIYLLFTLQSRGLRRERSVWLSPILLGGSVLFVTVTGHWILSIDRLFLAFVVVDNGSNPVEFYGDYSQPTQVLQSSLLLVSLAVVDGLFVHRLWTVWSHNRYVMILPCLTMLGLIISTIGGMYAFSQFKLGDSVDALANGWIIAESLFTVFTNMYCTVFISWRLWRVQNILKPAGGRSLNSVIVIIVESAALSTAWAFFFIAAYAVRSNLRFLIDVTPAVVGTANMLIYVRVGLGWTKTPAPATPVTAIRFNIASSPHLSEYGEEVGKKQVGLV
ncbi:hypothetical protein B0H16DRAFT_245286 [Mycena metata]|uniref:Uncharacterized protein n=1 Tax=Mycena metata TaxID=1033252 RepID=A0AAD7MQW6_9AGAR|nr:hypothetical protein B0H16DRAFT_245286 [Mycena metata]